MKELVDQLVKQLGVNEDQAAGGAGVLLNAARDKLGAQQFGSLLGGVPGIDQLMNRAPGAGSGGGGLLGGVASALGGQQGALLAGIVSGFSRLGLRPEQARDFVPVILGFLRGRIGPQNAEQLERTLRAGL